MCFSFLFRLFFMCSIASQLFFSFSVYAESDLSALRESLSSYTSERFNSHNIEGVSITLVDRERVIGNYSYGWADKAAQIPVTSKTLFRTGSLTMAFTAAAIMRLVSEGKILLDKPVAAYLQDWPDSGDKGTITVRQLLTHHSGLPLSYFKGLWHEDPVADKEVMTYIRSTPLSFPPGKIFAFSNLGYVALGELVSTVSGMPYTDYVQRYLLDPVEMRLSTFSVGKENRNLARSYRKGKVMPELEARDKAALGLISNAEELGNFMQIMLNDGWYQKTSVLKLAIVNSLIRQQNRNVKLDLEKKVGFGWRLSGIRLNGVKKIAWRFGATPAHRSRMIMLPEYGLGIVLLSNSSQSYEALEEISKGMLELVLKHRYKIEPYDTKYFASKVEYETPVQFASAYSTYMGLITLSKKQQKILADVMGWTFRLVPRENGWYSLTYDLLGFIPLNLEWIARTLVRPAVIQGESVLIAEYEGEHYLFGQQFEAIPVSESWRKRFGEYRIRNADTVLQQLELETGRLLVHNGFLVFEYRLPVWIPLYLYLPLEVVSEARLKVPGLGSGFNAYIDLLEAEKPVLRYSGYELEQLP